MGKNILLLYLAQRQEMSSVLNGCSIVHQIIIDKERRII